MTWPAISLRQALYIAGGIAFALIIAWALRLDSLRAKHLQSFHDCQTASKANAKAQADQKAAVERKYKEQADATDKAYEAELAEARSAVDEYIRTHRVRSSSVGATPSATDNSRASLPAEVPAAGVVVAETDVRACNDAIEYAWAAHGWSQTLNTPILNEDTSNGN